MVTRALFPLLALAALVFAAAPEHALAHGTGVHKVAIHVDQNDPKVMNLALNNAFNINKYYVAKGEVAVIEVVTYGPGLHMLRADTSPVKARIEAMSLELENLSFAACGNTKTKMTAKEGNTKDQ